MMANDDHSQKLMIKRTLIIGDVHGCFKELQLLLEKCDFKAEEDRLIFVGDVINKGPHSLKVLDFIIENNFECILGNHELGFLKSLREPTLLKRGFLKLFEEMGEKVSYYREWMESLPLYIEEDDFVVIHGGLQPGVPLANQTAMVATRIRTWGGSPEELASEENPPWYLQYEGDKLVVFGHWAAKGLIIRDNVIGLDSGCCWGGELTALALPERKIYQVKAIKLYNDPLTD